ncbi:MAG TPA: amino acid-binding protein [Clostridia bacterium]|nr:amino acid-binding protein [Clostridia bacterium]
MDSISKITVTEDVALITLRNSPADMKFVANAFDLIAQKSINVDMISQTAPLSERINLSFTISEEDLGAVIELLATLRADNPDIKSDISGSNCKISLYGEPMRFTPGVAAQVFDTIASLNLDVRIITTSEIDISILIPQAEYNLAEDAFAKVFHHHILSIN